MKLTARDNENFIEKVDSLLLIIGTDSIKETQVIYYYKLAFSDVTRKDPHFRIYPELRVKNKRLKAKDINVLPFSLMCINDTLIVNQSLCKDVDKGDRIIELDGISASTLLGFTYRDRYMNTILMQMQNHFHFSSNYNLILERRGKKIKLVCDGISLKVYNENFIKEKVECRIYDDIGYIRFDQFHNNGNIIKSFNKLIYDVKKKRGNSIIIDLRRNIGGSGDRFDDLISIFCDKNEVPYQKGVKLKVSEATFDYGFSRDSIGKIVSLPDSMFISKIPLNPKLYMGDYDYYVLVSRNTHSQASTFTNIIQYNKLGRIVGENLQKNALRYGEVMSAKFLKSVSYISTVEYDEYTNAIDGILKPDIEIPYIASKYMQGGDPVLEKLIDIIKSTNEKN
ncbi:S41 family peptidase [Carboxylicivirga sp. M1479]|uniref:S41 family peptidase n=1 Tax=Carboxylicivirga sp. M1479 TaxID=2594476 RepID=UPI00163DD2FD|nr:S41 family peptidase [Carboxylicivirga sp. M1479]